MDIEIFVHGVPNGQSFWGKEEDRNYFGNFYGQSNSDAVKYLIQTRSSMVRPIVITITWSIKTLSAVMDVRALTLDSLSDLMRIVKILWVSTKYWIQYLLLMF